MGSSGSTPPSSADGMLLLQQQTSAQQQTTVVEIEGIVHTPREEDFQWESHLHTGEGKQTRAEQNRHSFPMEPYIPSMHIKNKR